MLLSYTEICELIEQGVIANADYSCVNAGSLDIRLGDTLMVECRPTRIESSVLDYRARDKLTTRTVRIPEEGYQLLPGDFALGHSVEVFNLPNNVCAEYKLKSSMARVALEHLNAGWCDAGWNGSVLTLELINVSRYHTHLLRPGDAIGQIVFFRHTPVPSDRSYAARGRYNGDTSVSGIKE